MRPLRSIAGPVGPLDVLLEQPAATPAHTAVVFGHPHPLHGGTMHTKVVFRATKALASAGCAVLRFNFRGVGRSAGRFDEGAGEIEDFHAALTLMHTRYPAAELLAAGMSFGAWVASMAGARDDRVAAILGLAPPVNRYDFSDVRRSTKEKFFIHADQDEICPLPAMRAFFAELPEPKRLFVIQGATHLFVEKLDVVAETVRGIVADRQARHA